MDGLKDVVLNAYGLNLELTPFGDNLSRNNVFLGQTTGSSYIVKVESLKILNQVKLSIKISNALLGTNNLSSSSFLPTKSGSFFIDHEDKVITIQIKEEDLETISNIGAEALSKLGEALGEFHKVLGGLTLDGLKESDFYNDFMGNEVPLAQNPERLKQINEFYAKYSPDYAKLTKGVVHNDLNSNNIFLLKDKYFFIDFESLKTCPVVSDLGVLCLHLWDHNKGSIDFKEKLGSLLWGYEKKISVNEYDKENVIIFSIRYLYSDENWYNFWSQNGNPDAKDLIPEIKKKINLLTEIL